MTLLAGSAERDITPTSPQFLYGYPHVPRLSTGAHDPLLAAALALEVGRRVCLFLSADVIFVSKALTRAVRERVAHATAIPADCILLSATHTHSGPVTVHYLTNETDPVVPPPDPAYLRYLEDKLVDCAVAAWTARRPAELACVFAGAAGIGTNRHDPRGPSDLEVPVIAVRDRQTQAMLSLMLVCTMHPTVLHEDSTLFSGDFPAFAREYLRERVGRECAIVYHSGAAGNQSPRHVTTSNTFAEARRLGRILGRAVEEALITARYEARLSLTMTSDSIQLPARTPPSRELATTLLANARQRLAQLKATGANAATVRSAECDVFGAEETLAVANAAAEGRLQPALDACLPAEIQIIRVGGIAFVAWPGEFFVEYAHALRRRFPKARVITLANGDLQGYIVTQEAIDKQWYEAGNALLESPTAGRLILERTEALLESIGEVPRE